MSADNRTVATDALATLGTIITEREKRDAIHLAVIPCVAGVTLARGAHVRLDGGKAWNAGSLGDAVGIVDPFLDTAVEEGQWFWLVIYPRKITSLRHVWSHPAFPDEAPAPALDPEDVQESKDWLDRFANENDMDIGHEKLVKVALGERVKTDGYDDASEGYGYIEKREGHILMVGRSGGGEIPDEFWRHVQIVSGERIPKADRVGWFSCSC